MLRKMWLQTNPGPHELRRLGVVGKLLLMFTNFNNLQQLAPSHHRCDDPSPSPTELPCRHLCFCVAHLYTQLQHGAAGRSTSKLSRNLASDNLTTDLNKLLPSLLQLLSLSGVYDNNSLFQNTYLLAGSHFSAPPLDRRALHTVFHFR